MNEPLAVHYPNSVKQTSMEVAFNSLHLLQCTLNAQLEEDGSGHKLPSPSFSRRFPTFPCGTMARRQRLGPNQVARAGTWQNQAGALGWVAQLAQDHAARSALRPSAVRARRTQAKVPRKLSRGAMRALDGAQVRALRERHGPRANPFF